MREFSHQGQIEAETPGQDQPCDCLSLLFLPKVELCSGGANKDWRDGRDECHWKEAAAQLQPALVQAADYHPFRSS